jgi:hypothetical protein
MLSVMTSALRRPAMMGMQSELDLHQLLIPTPTDNAPL